MEKDGWLNLVIVDDFVDYVVLCFKYFGDWVKYWIILNEFWVIVILGYGKGIFVLGCEFISEFYLVGYYFILVYVKVVKVYWE